MEISYGLILAMAILGLEDFVNGRTLCSTIEDSAQFPLNTSALAHDALSYISPSVTGNSDGNLLALFTSTKFKCYGSIQSWSGLIHFDVGQGGLDDYSTPLMHLQVWRPHEERSSFSLVGSSSLMLHSVEMNGVDLIENDKIESGKFYYEFTVRLGGNATESEENPVIYFQPRDVVGCYIPAHANPPGFGFSNFSGEEDVGEEEVGMNMMLFSTTRLNCEVSVCDADASMVMNRYVVPQITSRFVVNEENDELGQAVSMCSNESATVCKETTACSECSSDELNGGRTVPGLMVVIAAVCLGAVCVVGITSNTIILCYARHKMKKRHRLKEKGNRNGTLCGLMVNPEAVQTGLPNNIRSLADFLEYNIQNESTTESFNVSWV